MGGFLSLHSFAQYTFISTYYVPGTSSGSWGHGSELNMALFSWSLPSCGGERQQICNVSSDGSPMKEKQSRLRRKSAEREEGYYFRHRVVTEVVIL